MNNGRYIVTGLIILILQLFACEFLNIWPPLYVAVLPLFIMLLPAAFNSYLLMLLAFGMGLVVDALSDGVLGLNATACTSVAFFKKTMLGTVMRYDTQTAINTIGSRVMGRAKFFVMMLMAYAIYFTIYVLLDGMGLGDILFILFRIILNVFVNALIACALESLFNYRVLRNG
ncbi:MAG: hypothetical protein ACI3Y2_06920 [Candidatus Egerieousia sp.]